MALGVVAWLEAVKAGQLRVPEAALNQALKALQLDGVQYRSCTCTATGVKIVVERSVLGVGVPVAVDLAVRAIELNAEAQRVTFEVLDVQIVGESWLVRVVAALAASMVLEVVKGAIESGSTGSEGVRVTREGERMFIADLSALPAIKKLRETKVPFVGTPVLTLLPPFDVEHAAGAVVLKKR